MAVGGLGDQPSATTLRVEELVDAAWRGQVRVPYFQRGFRWARDDVIKLFDSILKGYPIGSLLLWRRGAPARELRLGALRVQAEEMESALWVVDGQQRIVSLANALHPDGAKDPRFAIAYNLQSGKFVPGTGAGPLVIPLPVLFDLRQILGWFGKYHNFDEYADQAHEIATRLRQYPIPTYQVASDDSRVLEDIFDRLNNYGKRLRRSEIFAALHAAEGSDDASDPLTFSAIADRIDGDLRFGVIDDDTVMNAVLARRGPDVSRDIRIEFRDRPEIPESEGADRVRINFPGEDRDTAFREGEAALRRAVAFLQDVAGVPHVSMLAYRYLLVVLTRVFAHHPDPDPRNLRLLRRWYWRAAVVGPEAFKGGTTGAARMLAGVVRGHDLTGSVQLLLKLVPRVKAEEIDLTRFRANIAATKIALCSWWAKGPCSLETGALFTREDLAECLLTEDKAGEALRLVVRAGDVPQRLREFAANRVLMPYVQSDVREIRPLVVQRPFGLDEGPHEAVMRTHAITPEMADALIAGHITDFIDLRQGLLDAELNDFLAVMCEWDLEDTPPLEDLVIPDDGGADDAG